MSDMMVAVEFQTRVKDGTIEVPEQYRDQVYGAVRVIILTTTRAGAFLDTNVWLYAFITGQDPKKQQQAGALITSGQPLVVSTQVINEVCANMIRKHQSSEQEIRDFIGDFYVSGRESRPTHLPAVPVKTGVGRTASL